MLYRVLLVLIVSWACIQPLNAAASEPAILVIGASLSEAKVPFNDELQAPLGGISVALGSYLSLGNAYYMLRQYPEALENYNKAVRLDPDNQEARQMINSIGQC